VALAFWRNVQGPVFVDVVHDCPGGFVIEGFLKRAARVFFA
jgi:hypothetical protein